MPVLTPVSAVDSAIDAVEWGIANIERRRRVGHLRRAGRGHRRRQHRHGRSLTPTRRSSTSTAATSAAARSTTTTTGSTRRTSARVAGAVRQQRPRHPHDGHDGRRRRRAPTRSAWPPAPSGSRPRAARATAAPTPSLLAAGQWMLAPTDLAGANPQPGPAPEHRQQLVGRRQRRRRRRWYRATLTAWTAAGIFGVFSNGNAGPGCNTTGSPADNIEAYGVGAYDINNTIASFSSRGARRERLDPAQHLRARRRRPLEHREPGRQLRQLQRHVHGCPARLGRGRPPVVCRADARRRHHADAHAPRQHRDRHQRSVVRRDGGGQQRVRRRTPRRPRRGQPGPARGQWARSRARSPTV